MNKKSIKTIKDASKKISVCAGSDEKNYSSSDCGCRCGCSKSKSKKTKSDK